MKENKPLVSAAELDALIQGWGAVPDQPVDKFFPLRFWYLFIIAFAYCVWLLFWTDSAVQRMTSDPSEMLRMGRFLYFRGWFLLIVLSLGCYSYIKDWYPGIVFGSIFLMGCVNFVFDMFNVYTEVIASPTPRLTIMLIVRLIGLWFVYLTVKNSGRIPDLRDRFNILLPFKLKPPRKPEPAGSREFQPTESLHEEIQIQ